MTATDTLTDRLGTNILSEDNNSFDRPSLTSTSNILAANARYTYDLSNQLNVKPLMNTGSAPSYDDPSVTDARGDAFEHLLWNYNPSPITDEDEVAVLYIAKNDEVTKDNLESLEDYYSSFGKEADITTATLDDDFDDVYDAVYITDFPVAKYSQEAIDFYENICDLIDDDGVLVATFYSQEELDLVKYILEESDEFDIIAANMSNEGVEASYTVTDDYVNALKESLTQAKPKYEAAGVDIEAIINTFKPHVGHTVTFEYNKFVLYARKKCSDEDSDDDGHGYHGSDDEDDTEMEDDEDGNDHDDNEDGDSSDGDHDSGAHGEGGDHGEGGEAH